MSIVTINEAANLVGKSIKTIYRHIESGKLSCVIDDNGRKMVDISELVRVYGLDLTLAENNNGVSRGHLRKRNLKYVKAESRQVANGTR